MRKYKVKINWVNYTPRNINELPKSTLSKQKISKLDTKHDYCFCGNIKYKYAIKCRKCFHLDIIGEKNSMWLGGRLGIRLRKYRITYNDYIKALKKQNNKCGICKQEFKEDNFYFDHNHKTKKFRGLLCSNCNLGIGLLKDNKKIINNAVKYLK